MKAWEEYAFIVDGIVQNVACFKIGGYTEATIVAREVYGEDCQVVNVTQIPTAMGDIYRNGAFYRKDEKGNEEEIPTILTEEQAVDALNLTTKGLETSTESNTTAIDDILVMLLDDTSTTEATDTEEATE